MPESLGRLLREKRESLGLTLAEVERRTHIRTKYLAGIEADDHSLIPSAAQARGFIRSYAALLGLDADELLARVGGTRPRLSQPAVSAQPTPVASRPVVRMGSPARNLMRLDVILSAALGLTVIGLLGWGAYQIMAYLARERSSATAVPAAFVQGLPSELASPALASTGSGAGTEAPAAPGGAQPIAPAGLPTLAPTPLGGVYTTVRIHIDTVHRAFVHVLVDGKEAFLGRVTPGQTLEYEGRESVTVICGDGSALRVTYNGTAEGLLGGLAEPVIRVWTLAGVKTPTPSVTPTPTATLTPTVTPRFTATAPTPAQPVATPGE